MAAGMKDSGTCAMRRSWGPCLGSTNWCLKLAQQPASWSPTRLQTMEDAIRPSKPWPHARSQICSRPVLAQKARLTARTSALKANSIAKGSSGSPRPAFRATPETTPVRKPKLNVPCALRAAIPSLRAPGKNARHVKGASSHSSMVPPLAPFAVQANSRLSPGFQRATGANQDPTAMLPFLTLVPSAHLAPFQTPLASQAVNHAVTGPTHLDLAFQPARCVGLAPIWSSLWPTPTTPITTPTARPSSKLKRARLNAWSAVAGHTAGVRVPRRSAFLVQLGPSRSAGSHTASYVPPARFQAMRRPCATTVCRVHSAPLASRRAPRALPAAFRGSDKWSATCAFQDGIRMLYNPTLCLDWYTHDTGGYGWILTHMIHVHAPGIRMLTTLLPVCHARRAPTRDPEACPHVCCVSTPNIPFTIRPRHALSARPSTTPQGVAK
jgi:hypothetical protein